MHAKYLPLFIFQVCSCLLAHALKCGCVVSKTIENETRAKVKLFCRATAVKYILERLAMILQWVDPKILAYSTSKLNVIFVGHTSYGFSRVFPQEKLKGLQ